MTEETKPKSTRGFASMSPERQREIARMGGRSVPSEQRSFARNKDLAREAGRLLSLKLTELTNAPTCRLRSLALPFQPHFTRAEWERRATNSGIVGHHAEALHEERDRTVAVAGRALRPVHGVVDLERTAREPAQPVDDLRLGLDVQAAQLLRQLLDAVGDGGSEPRELGDVLDAQVQGTGEPPRHRHASRLEHLRAEGGNPFFDYQLEKMMATLPAQ